MADGDLECAFDEDLEWLFKDDEDDLDGDLEWSFDLDPSLECPALPLPFPFPFRGPK